MITVSLHAALSYKKIIRKISGAIAYLLKELFAWCNRLDCKFQLGIHSGDTDIDLQRANIGECIFITIVSEIIHMPLQQNKRFVLMYYFTPLSYKIFNITSVRTSAIIEYYAS